MKRILSFIIATVFLFLFAVSVYSVDIDGVDGAEWRGAEVMTLFKGESNSDVTFGSVKWIVDEAVNVVYFCFQFHEEDITVSESCSGAILKVNSSDSVRVICDGNITEYNSDLYAISGAGTRNENNGSNCEFKVGFKRGIPAVINAEVTFIDSEGNTSNLYRFTIDGVTETQTESQPSTATVTEILIPEIIKPATTKKAEKLTEKTTRKKKETSTKKASTTKSKSKTTKAALTSTETEMSTDTAVSITQSAAETSSALFLQTSIPSSNGKRYKYITMGASAAVIALVVVLGISAANKKAKENDPKS